MVYILEKILEGNSISKLPVLALEWYDYELSSLNFAYIHIGKIDDMSILSSNNIYSLKIYFIQQILS